MLRKVSLLLACLVVAPCCAFVPLSPSRDWPVRTLSLRGGGRGVSTMKADDASYIAGAADRVIQTQAPMDIILPFRPQGSWLWRQWKGTILPVAWRDACFNMLVGCILSAFIRLGTPTDWPLFTVPDKGHVVISRLQAVFVLWTYTSTLATFILTFFLGQAYSYWRKSFGLGRSIQGRLHDLCVLVATHAQRDRHGKFTPAARKLLADHSRNIKALHVLFWSGIDKSLSSLHTPAGLNELVARGVLSERERETIENPAIKPTWRHNVVNEWILGRILAAREAGVLRGGDAFDGIVLDKACTLRGTCGSIPDEISDRTPLAYMHVVHLLVDTFLVLSPVALYPQAGALCVPLSGLLTLFYRGLLELSKSFLDPFGNEGSEAQNVQTDVLIAEVNAGVPRWTAGAEELPYKHGKEF
jgi:hypothetical protein